MTKLKTYVCTLFLREGGRNIHFIGSQVGRIQAVCKILAFVYVPRVVVVLRIDCITFVKLQKLCCLTLEAARFKSSQTNL
jgi:hypothetical protein